MLILVSGNDDIDANDSETDAMNFGMLTYL